MRAVGLRACLLAFCSVGAQGSYDLIAGYEPGSDVIQHSRIDLDQKEMESHLGASPPDYVKAEAIYSLGGNSGAHASITVSALAADAAKGAEVKQGTVGVGKMKKAGAAGVAYGQRGPAE